MLAHWWRKSFTCWCKYPNISIIREMKSSSKCRSRYDITFAWAVIVIATFWEEAIPKTRSTWVKSTSCVVVRSPPWTQQSKCILLGSMVWLYMHWEKPWIVGWGKPNLVCSVKEKMLETILTNEMIGWVEIQTLEPRLAQDLNWMWWQFEQL